jgi:hypothetical protein
VTAVGEFGDVVAAALEGGVEAGEVADILGFHDGVVFAGDEVDGLLEAGDDLGEEVDFGFGGGFEEGSKGGFGEGAEKVEESLATPAGF